MLERLILALVLSALSIALGYFGVGPLIRAGIKRIRKR